MLAIQHNKNQGEEKARSKPKFKADERQSMLFAATGSGEVSRRRTLPGGKSTNLNCFQSPVSLVHSTMSTELSRVFDIVNLPCNPRKMPFSPYRVFVIRNRRRKKEKKEEEKEIYQDTLFLLCRDL